MFSRLHRRTLLAGALLGAGFGAALPLVVRSAESSSLDGYGYDVIVLGSGAGGFTAAVRSAESGARTLLLEAAPWLGGASRIATGIFGCAGHPIQKAHGHTTTADDLYALYLSEASATHTRAEQTVAKMLAYGAVDAADWLASLGVRWSQKTSQPFFLHVEEGHRLGELLIDALERKARAENVTILTRTRATRLLTENGRVVGVEADTRSGPRTFRAKAVVLATGGFEAAPDWIRKYVGHGWERAGVYCTPYNRGDGQRMAEAIGVPLDDMAVMKANPTIHVSGGNRYNLISTVRAGAIAVNRKGERVINETGGYWESHRIQANPNTRSGSSSEILSSRRTRDFNRFSRREASCEPKPRPNSKRKPASTPVRLKRPCARTSSRCGRKRPTPSGARSANLRSEVPTTPLGSNP